MAAENRDPPFGAKGSERLPTSLLIVVLVLSAAALLWRFHADPFDHGYTRYAGLAAEMVRSGDWIVMRAAGEPYFNKPPLYVWLIAVPMKLLGRTNGFAQHVPDALAVAVALGFTWAFARRWFGARNAGPCAALVLASSLGFNFLARGKRIDPLFTAWLTGCFYFAWCAFEESTSQRERIVATLAGSFLLALAVLTKGPVALLFYALVIVPYAIWRGRARQLVSRESLAGLALLLGVVAVWPALVVHELGLARALAGLSTVEIGRAGSPLHYAASLPRQLLPWSALLPALAVFLRAAWPRRGSASSTALAFALFWLAGVLLPIQLSHAKHFRYALPAFPAFALLVTALWYHPTAAHLRSAWEERLSTAPLVLLFGSVVLATVGLPLAFFLHPDWRGVAPVVVPPVVGAGLAGLSGIRRLFAARDARGAFERAVVAVSLAFVAADGAFAHFEANAQRPTLEALAPLVRGEPAVGYRLTIGAWSRVLLETGVSLESCSSPAEVVSWLHALPGGEGWVVTSRRARSGILENPGLAFRGEPIEHLRVELIAVADPARSPPTTGGYRAAR